MKMNKLLSKIIVFAAGAVTGSVVTYKLVEHKFRQHMQEEIEAVREFYGVGENVADKLPKESDDDEDEQACVDAPSEYYEKTTESERSRYRNIAKDHGYIEEEEDDMDKPYVIRPEEYGEEGYVQQSLTYYADGIITNERGKIIKNADELIGINPEDHFGEYEDDSVFVRNDAIKIDYEILKDYREYSEIN